MMTFVTVASTGTAVVMNDQWSSLDNGGNCSCSNNSCSPSNNSCFPSFVNNPLFSNLILMYWIHFPVIWFIDNIFIDQGQLYTQIHQHCFKLGLDPLSIQQTLSVQSNSRDWLAWVPGVTAPPSGVQKMWTPWLNFSESVFGLVVPCKNIIFCRSDFEQYGIGRYYIEPLRS